MKPASRILIRLSRSHEIETSMYFERRESVQRRDFRRFTTMHRETYVGSLTNDIDNWRRVSNEK